LFKTKRMASIILYDRTASANMMPPNWILYIPALWLKWQDFDQIGK